MRICTYRHDRAYVCMHMKAWSRLCVHAHEGMIAPMCAYTWSCTCVHAQARMIMCVCAYTWRHDRACVCIYLIIRICASTCRHDSAYVCIYVQEWSRLCVHIGKSIIMCWTYRMKYIHLIKDCLWDGRDENVGSTRHKDKVLWAIGMIECMWRMCTSLCCDTKMSS